MLFKVLLIVCIRIVLSQQISQFGTDSSCPCVPHPKTFNETISDQVQSSCRKCYFFTYDFNRSQEWAVNLCVESYNTSWNEPLFVIVRESLGMMSFQVPLIFPDVSPFFEVCRTLCPLGSFRNCENCPVLPSNQQNISVEISTSSPRIIDFKMRLAVVENFLLSKDEPVTVTITPSKPHMMKYVMEEDLRAVRVEATSEEDNCMILSIQSLQCHVHDSKKPVTTKEYHQTLTKLSGIFITQTTFPGGKQYVVLKLKPTSSFCEEESEDNISQSSHLQKTVTVRIVPTITDKEFIIAIIVPLIVFMLIYLIFFTFLCLSLLLQFVIYLLRNGNSDAPNENSTETGYLPDREIMKSQEFENRRKHTAEMVIMDGGEPTTQSHDTPSGSSPVPEPSNSQSQNNSPEQLNMDNLADVELDENVAVKKSLLTVADLAKKRDKVIINRSKIYAWNLVTVGVFYGLPVIQLVYINQRIVNLTGDQDLCYYNFLCSHQVGLFSDFNHVYSNIGYIMLGLLFLLIVLCREKSDHSSFAKQNAASQFLPKPSVPVRPHPVTQSNRSFPPKPCLNVSSDEKGITLQWDIPGISPQQQARICRFQILGYQEMKGSPINTLQWNEIGLVDAMSLPMACTLAKFVDRSRCHFTIRAIDKNGGYSRCSNVTSITYQKPPVLTGIPRHFGLLYAMGWALVMEGLLSASYHICPNRTNFQFDTAFMYVICSVCMLKLYQSRHPDIIARSHNIWMILAVVIAITFLGVITSGIYVWLFFTFCHLLATLVVCSKIYYVGHMRIKSILEERCQKCCVKPEYPVRFAMLVLAVLVNIAFDIYGLITQPPNFASFVLNIFLLNALIYLLYYIFMKIKSSENIGLIPGIFSFLSLILWLVAYFLFFKAERTSWEETPAESRNKNAYCQIFNFYDEHDIWHFLSSCALFCSFMVFLTLDDDLDETPRTEINPF